MANRQGDVDLRPPVNTLYWLVGLALRLQAEIEPVVAPSISSCFIFFVGNTINGGTDVPVAFIQATTVIRFPHSTDVTCPSC
jgi:hypothetical protein